MALDKGFEKFVKRAEPLAPHTWFHLGGPAEYFAEPRTVEELQSLVRRCRETGTVVRILGREGRTLRVAELDAVDGTPVLDIKPVMREFLPRGEVRQPAWVAELMRDYWATADEGQRTKD